MNSNSSKISENYLLKSDKIKNISYKRKESQENPFALAKCKFPYSSTSSSSYINLYHNKFKIETLKQKQQELKAKKKMFIIINKKNALPFLSILFIIFVYHSFKFANCSNIKNASTTTTTTNLNINSQPKLDCQIGELRYFNYESSTKVWGSESQQVNLRGSLSLRCMEPNDNNTLKYLAEILSLTSTFGDNNQIYDNNNSKKIINNSNGRVLLKNSKQQQQLLAAKLNQIKSRRQNSNAQLVFENNVDNNNNNNNNNNDDGVKAEPVLEEIAETADRVKQSVSGWFNKTWSTVKDFFTNIFTTSERTTINREQAFKDIGIDISGQCKASKGGSNRMPIDDSVFDDLEPKYYISASSIETTANSNNGFSYNFNNDDDDDDDDLNSSSELLSFFDDPKPIIKEESFRRSKRAIQVWGGDNNNNNEKLLKIPFIFVQSKTGKILEIKFSNLETDLSVKNFKRHICDLFATNLDKNKNELNEISPLGRHKTNYLVDTTNNSSEIKQSLLESASTVNNSVNNNNNNDNNSHKGEQSKQLIRALAVVSGGGGGLTTSEQMNNIEDDDDDYSDKTIESRDHSNGYLDSKNITNLSILRSINSTNNINMNSKIIAPSDIDKINVQIKQVQQISDGRMVGTAGQLGMSLIQANGKQVSNNKYIYFSTSGNKREKREADQQPVDDIGGLLQVSTTFSVQLVPLSKLGNSNSIVQIMENPSIKQQQQREATASRTRARRGATIVDNNSGDSAALNKNENIDQKINGSSNSGENNSKKFLNLKLASNVAPNNTTIKENGNSTTKSFTMLQSSNDSKKKVNKRVEPLFIIPKNFIELKKIISDMKNLETELQFKSSTNSLQSESSIQDGQLQRLELLRDQIQMRLNEEFMRNRMRHSNSARQMAAVTVSNSISGNKKNNIYDKNEKFKNTNDFGLSLTQLVIDSGITSKRKGSVYSTLEEIIQLESLINGQDLQKNSISRLLRDTVRIDKLKNHCKTSIATLDEIKSQSAKLELKNPFNVDDDYNDYQSIYSNANSGSISKDNKKFSRIVNNLTIKNRKKLEQCKQVSQLLLQLGDKQAADLIIDLIDECNNRLLASAKVEELGYGPTSRYYRNLRQQFIELLSNLNKPNESILDRLMYRLQFKQTDSLSGELNSKPQRKIYSSSSSSAAAAAASEPEFTYVSPTTINKPKSYNRSLLKEEDDFNNNDGAGSLVMTITELASKPSISRVKKVEISDKLLTILKSSTCSLFNGPDLDILESMGNFQEPIDEIVGKIVHLARRCKLQDQYLVACVHGLQGQLSHSIAQKFLIEQLKSQNVSCTVKSEIVLTLIGAILQQDLKQQYQSINDDDSKKTLTWPLMGLNQVDEVLLDIINNDNIKQKSKSLQTDKKCLSSLINYYMSKKLLINSNNNIDNRNKKTLNNNINSNRSNRAQRPQTQRRHKRAVINDNDFWDDAYCKRWILPPTTTTDDTNNTFNLNNSPTSLADDLLNENDIDDNSIIAAIAANSSNKPARSSKQNGKLIERESDSSLLVNGTSSSSNNDNNLNNKQSISPSNTNTNTNQQQQQQFIRKRHKCTASKSYGPKSAKATLKAEIVNDLVGSNDENKFLARFRLSGNFFGNQIDVGRMYLWHQKRITRARVNILGKSLWDTSHSCLDKAPNHLIYMPLFDFNLWLVKISLGLRIQSEMGFFSNCNSQEKLDMNMGRVWGSLPSSNSKDSLARTANPLDELELYPTISLKASGEASAKFVVARAGISLASQYGYQGSIRVSKQPESCMSIYSSHQPMNVTLSAWFQLWDSDCHYWGSRNKAEPQATRWKLSAKRPTAWLEDECLSTSTQSNNSTSDVSLLKKSPLSISP